MPIKFEKLTVRIISPAILKQSRKHSHYKVAIIEPLGTRLHEHWYANMYPSTVARSKDAYDHVAALSEAGQGATICIAGQVRKFMKGDSQFVVLYVTAAEDIFPV